MKKLLLSTTLFGAMAFPALAQDQTIFREAPEAMDIRASDFTGMRLYASETAPEGQEAQGIQEGWDDIGEVQDVVLNRDGQVQAVLVDIGGFLGIGERTVAVSMDALQFLSDSETAENADDFFLVVNASREQLEAAPEYTAGQTGEMTAEQAAEQTDQAIDEGASNVAATGAAVGAAAGAAVGSAVEGTENAGEAVVDATGDAAQATGTAVENAGDAVADAAGTAAEGTENAVEETGEEVAQAGGEVADQSEALAEGTATTETETEADQTAAAATDATGTDTMAATDDATAGAATTTVTDTEQTSAQAATAREGFVAAGAEDFTADRLQGAAVYDQNDQRVGEVGEILLSDDGQVSDLVIDVGGFLGIGEKPVAMAMDSVSILRQEGGDEIRVYVSQAEDELEALPTYEAPAE